MKIKDLVGASYSSGRTNINWKQQGAYLFVNVLVVDRIGEYRKKKSRYKSPKYWTLMSVKIIATAS
jgi:hypothetical protein